MADAFIDIRMTPLRLSKRLSAATMKIRLTTPKLTGPAGPVGRRVRKLERR